MKIIIDLSDGYLEERADPDNMTQRVQNGEAPLIAMADMMAFGVLKRKAKNGGQEVIISSKDEMSKDTMKLFNHSCSMLAAVAAASGKLDN